MQGKRHEKGSRAYKRHKWKPWGGDRDLYEETKCMYVCMFTSVTFTLHVRFSVVYLLKDRILSVHGREDDATAEGTQLLDKSMAHKLIDASGPPAIPPASVCVCGSLCHTPLILLPSVDLLGSALGVNG